MRSVCSKKSVGLLVGIPDEERLFFVIKRGLAADEPVVNRGFCSSLVLNKVLLVRAVADSSSFFFCVFFRTCLA